VRAVGLVYKPRFSLKVPSRVSENMKNYKFVKKFNRRPKKI
jgi:hypothetical protein